LSTRWQRSAYFIFSRLWRYLAAAQRLRRFNVCGSTIRPAGQPAHRRQIAMILSWMIWRTLLIPHTMAATGSYRAARVFVGKFWGRQILALTSLPEIHRSRLPAI
jgi:hypothetical protein